MASRGLARTEPSLSDRRMTRTQTPRSLNGGPDHPDGYAAANGKEHLLRGDDRDGGRGGRLSPRRDGARWPGMASLGTARNLKLCFGYFRNIFYSVFLDIGGPRVTGAADEVHATCVGTRGHQAWGVRAAPAAAGEAAERPERDRVACFLGG